MKTEKDLEELIAVAADLAEEIGSGLTTPLQVLRDESVFYLNWDGNRRKDGGPARTTSYLRLATGWVTKGDAAIPIKVVVPERILTAARAAYLQEPFDESVLDQIGYHVKLTDVPPLHGRCGRLTFVEAHRNCLRVDLMETAVHSECTFALPYTWIHRRAATTAESFDDKRRQSEQGEPCWPGFEP